MPLDRDVDVVVVGFGLAGAVASLAAAEDGARVLVLDQAVSARRRFAATCAGRFGHEGLAGVRASALAAGVEVRTGCRVHELVVTAGEISGVGYATLPSRGVTAMAHRWLRASSSLVPAAVAPPLTRAADAVWRSAFLVGEVTCSSVVLALAPRHWEFVGPAVWTAVRAAERTGKGTTTSMPSRPRRLRVVPPVAAAAPAMAELPVRRWCAGQEASSACQEELRGDEETGAVLAGEQSVPGLYSAVPVVASGTGGPEGAFTAGQRAGHGAAVAVGRAPGAALLSVV
jgi:hypothetical protein